MQSFQRSTSRARRRIAFCLAGLALVMVGLSFAAVPLYAFFCRATGYAGTPQIAAHGANHLGQRHLTLRFDTNVAPGLGWTLTPQVAAIGLRTGETATVYFTATNLTATESAAVAAFNVTPEQTGAWFNKLACFCFNEQHLGPHEQAEWPVVFFLDPNLETDPTMAAIDTLTLSYTVFAARRPPSVAAVDLTDPGNRPMSRTEGATIKERE
jgi:cytochrome c oxidase assembly protein subunit 11